MDLRSNELLMWFLLLMRFSFPFMLFSFLRCTQLFNLRIPSICCNLGLLNEFQLFFMHAESYKSTFLLEPWQFSQSTELFFLKTFFALISFDESLLNSSFFFSGAFIFKSFTNFRRFFNDCTATDSKSMCVYFKAKFLFDVRSLAGK